VCIKAVEAEERKANTMKKAHMLDIIGSLTDLFTEAIKSAFPELGGKTPQAVMSVATNPKFGDYQCNSAMGLVQVAVIYTLVCVIYTLVCVIYTLVCVIYDLVCVIYTLVCNIYLVSLMYVIYAGIQRCRCQG